MIVNRGCLLVCEKCKGKKAIYIRDSMSRCSFCCSEIKIEEGIVDLVMALNNYGIITISSCAGHRGDFENGRSYPCVVLLKDGRNYQKAEDLVENYNLFQKKEDGFWATEMKKCTLGWEKFIFPKRVEKNLEKLHKEVLSFSRYIDSLS
jgi:hypothetical protein